jgi:hydroxymethylpyrimidine/phosphomethylpyrimidine kinase
MNTIPPNILTIAGSDSGGGAGIQADLKTIAMLEGYGLSVITALTAQNTLGVRSVEAPSAAFVAEQLETVLDDIPVRAAKTGMLFSSEIVEAVVRGLAGTSFPLVVDPVCVSASGHRLLEEDAVRVLADRLLPMAAVVTPNRLEAEWLTGLSIRSADDVLPAMEKLTAMGAGAVLLKGGHFEDGGPMIDWFMRAGGEVVALEQPRIDTVHTHGTGCALSAAVAAGLGRGLELEAAVRRAQDFLHLGLRSGYALGGGYGPPHHLALKMRQRRRGEILEDLARIGSRLRRIENFARLVPEVRMNVGLALPWAEDRHDVAAFAGRITTGPGGEIMMPGCPAFGASSHMAKVVLAARRVDPEVECAANVRYSDEILAALDRLGFVRAWFDRADEPDEVKALEGSSLEWGTYKAMSEHPEPTAVATVCDRGEPGKEAMVRILARSADELVERLAALAAALE